MGSAEAVRQHLTLCTFANSNSLNDEKISAMETAIQERDEVCVLQNVLLSVIFFAGNCVLA